MYRMDRFINEPLYRHRPTLLKGNVAGAARDKGQRRNDRQSQAVNFHCRLCPQYCVGTNGEMPD